MNPKREHTDAALLQILKQHLGCRFAIRGAAAGITAWLVTGMALGIGGSVFTSTAFAQPPLPEVLELPYTDAQYAHTARGICIRIDTYKADSSSIRLKRPGHCGVLPTYCANESKKYLEMKAFIRTTVASGLKIETSDTLEAQLPTILSKLMTYPCSKISRFAIKDVPFHSMKRNIAKRAIFTGQTKSFFSDFVFEDFSSTYRDGDAERLAMRIDINAVEMVEGEPETLLDYIDKVLAHYTDTYLGREPRSNITALRNTLLRIGAMNAADLNCTEPHQIYCPVREP